MLVLTEKATSVIRTLGQHPELPDDAGLRIAGSGNGTEHLTAVAAASPREGDHIVEQDGARVFLEETAAQMLADKVLDAQIDGEGSVEFHLARQAEQ